MSSLRVPLVLAALLLIAATASADTLSFQQGDGGAYSTTDATSLNRTSNNYGSELGIGAQLGGTDSIESLLRFPDIIGSHTGQILPGSTIISASLQMTMIDAPLSPVPTDIHEVFAAWDENTVTGNSFYAQPGTLYGPKVGTMPVSVPLGQVSADVTSLVQGWAAGATNFGLMFRLSVPGLTIYYSDDAPELGWRPRLTVEFTPPIVAVEQTTWGKVKSLYR
jgi:hypothetical protein